MKAFKHLKYVSYITYTYSHGNTPVPFRQQTKEIIKTGARNINLSIPSTTALPSLLTLISGCEKIGLPWLGVQTVRGLIFRQQY